MLRKLSLHRDMNFLRVVGYVRITSTHELMQLKILSGKVRSRNRVVLTY